MANVEWRIAKEEGAYAPPFAILNPLFAILDSLFAILHPHSVGMRM